MTPSYKEALRQARKIGASKAEGHALLAQSISAIAQVHGGLNPELVYNGAVKKGMLWPEVKKLWKEDGAIGLGDLMFSADPGFIHD